MASKRVDSQLPQVPCKRCERLHQRVQELEQIAERRRTSLRESSISLEKAEQRVQELEALLKAEKEAFASFARFADQMVKNDK